MKSARNDGLALSLPPKGDLTYPLGVEDANRRFCLDCRYPLVGLRDTRCPECGRLFDPNDPESYSVDVGGLVRLFTGQSDQAHLLKDILQDAGIKAVVLGDALDVTHGFLPGMHGTLPAVWVGGHDLERATPIAEEFAATRHEGLAPVGAPWVCPACEEPMEGQFTTCWSCGADRPDDVAEA